MRRSFITPLWDACVTLSGYLHHTGNVFRKPVTERDIPSIENPNFR